MLVPFKPSLWNADVTGRQAEETGSVPHDSRPEHTGGEGTAAELVILIVSYNAQTAMMACLTAIEPLFRTCIAEVWVVDNASSDNSAVMIANRYPWAHLIQNTRNVGFAAAVNQVVAVSRGAYVLLLNPDVLPMPKTVSLLLTFLRATPDCAGVGPLLLNPDGTEQQSAHAFPTPLRVLSECLLGHRFTTRRRPGAAPVAVDAVVGACFLIRRAVIDAIGSLDERFFLYSEEVDWCLRAQRAGWRMYLLPEAMAVHGLAQSSKDQPEKGFVFLFRGRDQYMQKHFSPWGRRVSHTGIVIGLLLRAVFWGILSAVPASAERRKHRRSRYRRYKAVLRWYGEGRPDPHETNPVEVYETGKPTTRLF